MYLNNIWALAIEMSGKVFFRVLTLAIGLVIWTVYGTDALLVTVAFSSFLLSLWNLALVGRSYGRGEFCPYRNFFAAGSWVALGITILAGWYAVNFWPIAGAYLLLSLVTYPASHLWYWRKFRRSLTSTTTDLPVAETEGRR